MTERAWWLARALVRQSGEARDRLDQTMKRSIPTPALMAGYAGLLAVAFFRPRPAPAGAGGELGCRVSQKEYG